MPAGTNDPMLPDLVEFADQRLASALAASSVDITTRQRGHARDTLLKGRYGQPPPTCTKPEKADSTPWPLAVLSARVAARSAVYSIIAAAGRRSASGSAPSTQQRTELRRRNRVIVALLLLALATLLAGPVGFIVVGLLLLAWAIVTGTLHLVIDLLLLPFRAIGALARDRG
jgi:hypothetical protein